MSVTTAGPGRPAQVPSEGATAAWVRRARLRAAVSARGVPAQAPVSHSRLTRALDAVGRVT